MEDLLAQTGDDDIVDKLHHSDADDDEFTSDRQHDKLLEAISSLSGKKRGSKKQRSEPVSAANEFHTSAGQEKVNLHELVSAVKGNTSHSNLKKQLNRVQKRAQVLAAPLPKHEQERINRTLAYDKVSKELKKWDPVIDKNRKAEQIQFPLKQPDLRLITTDKFVKRFQPRTPLEMEVAKLLHGSDNVLRNDQVLTPAEERALKAMSIEEAKERRAELQKYRALLSYKEAKARRTKKIKSKRYHRILRKEKLKQEKKTLEELEKTDPEAYLEKLQQMERQRMQERMSLKHRGGSKFMKKQAMFAKYDDNARQAIQDMIKKNKELSQKLVQQSDEEDLHSDNEPPETVTGDNKDRSKQSKNPWMAGGIVKRSVFAKPLEIVNTDTLILNTQLGEKTEHNSKQGKSNELVEKGVSDSNHSGDEKDMGEVVSEQSEDENDINEVVSEQSEDDTQSEKSSKKLKAEQFENIDDIFSVAEKQKFKEKKHKEKTKRHQAKEKKEKQEMVRKKRIANKIHAQKQVKKQKEESSDSESESDFSDSDSEIDKGKEIKEKGREVKDQRDEGEGLATSLKRKQKLDDFEGNWSDEEKDTITYTPDLASFKKHTSEQSNTKSSNQQTQKNIKEVRLDPNKFFTVESTVHQTNDPQLVDSEDDEQRTEAMQRMTIAQAFASDDVIEEFLEEKKEIEERDKPKDIDLTLPGWGDWGGAGLQPSKRKRRRFMVKAPKAPPRKDRDLTNVIISETKDTAVTKHQVKQVPFPFTSVHDFQNSIRQPVGRTWNPETSYRAMIQPKVTTKLGTVIEPIDKSEVFKNEKNRRKGFEELGGRSDASSKSNKNSKKHKGKGDNQSNKRKSGDAYIQV